MNFRYAVSLSDRPFFRVAINRKDLFATFLYDSGAEMSVWTSYDMFFHVFPNAVKVDQMSISGFGGAGDVNDVYNVGTMILAASDGSGFVFNNMHFALSRKQSFLGDAVLSPSLFHFCRTLLSPSENMISFLSGANVFNMKYNCRLKRVEVCIVG